jgi:hypothetical protein
MATLRTAAVDRALVGKLGFKRTETHHHVYRLWLDGVLVARTYISHGGRELSRYHVGQMARQMQLHTAEFLDAVNCPLSREDYERILRERVLADED